MAPPLPFLEAVDVFDSDAKHVHSVMVWEVPSDGFFFAVSPLRSRVFMGKGRGDLDSCGQLVDLAGFFPPFVPSVHQEAVGASSHPDAYYIKRHSMCYALEQGSLAAKHTFKDIVSAELDLCQKLKRFGPTSPTLPTFRGVVVREGLIVALCFDKYYETLHQRVKRAACTVKKDAVLAGVGAAVGVLHRLGYCHNDINPTNIMFASSDDDTPVLIDFDSARSTGEELLKGGTPGWVDEDLEISLEANDTRALRALDEYLTQCKCACA